MKKQTLAIFSALAGLALAASTASATIIIVDGSTTWDRNADPGTFDASGSDKLVVIVTGEHHFGGNTSGNVVSITYDGVPLTLAVERDPFSATDQTANEIWYLDAPATSGGVIDVSFTGNNWVVTALGLSNTLPGVGATVISSPASRTVDLTAGASDSLVIASFGMGGSGNFADVINVDADAPATELSALEIGSNWAGHVSSYTNGVAAGSGTYSFTGGTLAGSHVIAAEFLAAPIPEPSSLAFFGLAGLGLILRRRR